MNVKNIRVIVPCFQSDNTIERCLNALQLSENVEFEIIVVDDGENSKIPLIRDQFPIKVFSTCGRTGAGAARNLGTNGFNGGIIVFVDSDVEVAPDAISLLTAPIIKGAADATVGRYSHDILGLNFAQAYKHLYLAYTYGKGKSVLTNTYWTALGAIRTEIFRELGGFSEEFRGAGPEDIELGVRLTKMQGKILAVPKATACHLASINILELFLNDLRKGTEDIYIHWTSKISLTDNRHASIIDILSVLFSGLVMLFLFAIPYIGHLPITIATLSYFALRAHLLFNGFYIGGICFFIISLFITLALDVIRGFSVLFGTALVAIKVLSRGKYCPFT